MKLPERTEHSPRRDRWQNAIIACDSVDVPAQETDGSGRLIRYCRAVKRHGFEGDEALKIIRLVLAKYPIPKEWTDDQILSRIGKAKVESGEAYENDTLPPWERASAQAEIPDPKPESKKSAPQKDESPFTSGFDALTAAMLSVERRDKEIIYDCGPFSPTLEIGPGKVAVIGAPPGAGKTALASQVCFECLQNHPELTLVIANAEMDPSVLVRREMARRSGINYQKIRFAEYTDTEADRLSEAAREMSGVMRRTSIMEPPYSMDRLVQGLSEDRKGIVVVDYLQKFRAAATETQEGIEAVMGWLRYIARSGWAVLALSSTARSDGGKGGNKHDTSKLDLGAFKGSGEIEFQADSAYVLRDLSGGAEGDRSMKLDCLKNRHGPRGDVDMTFCVSSLSFEFPKPDNYETAFDNVEF